jgi:hypothetical protein
LTDWFVYLKPIPHTQLTHHLHDRGSKYLWNTGKLLPDYMALQPRRHPSLFLLPREPRILLINLLMLFKEIIPVYTENHRRPINTKCTVTGC